MTRIISSQDSLDLHKLATETFEALDGNVIMGVPIGIGKAPNLLNAFYEVAEKNPQYSLNIHTALALSKPETKSDLEERLLGPFFDRQFKGVIDLKFARAARNQQLPKNVKVVQFYFKPGEMLRNPGAQFNALSVNYTHIALIMANRGCNLVTQSICKKITDGKTRYSLSSNPDVTLDLLRHMRDKTAKDGQKRIMIVEVNKELPFMPNDAEVPEDFFDIIVDHPSARSSLFAVPQQPISATDHMIGFYSSLLIQDGGTLQIGIGSLGDAIANALLVRHNKNADYKAILERTNAIKKFPIITKEGGSDTFKEGLYGNTEMLVPGYLELKTGGVLKRRVYDDLTIQELINEGFAPDQINLQWIDALQEKKRIRSPLNADDVEYLKHWGLLKDSVTFTDGKLQADKKKKVPELADKAFRTWLEASLLGEKILHGRLMHAGFFVGNQQFYDTLHKMSDAELEEINMTSVDVTNHLHGDEKLRIAQRKGARFINACMKTTLAGASVSDALDDGQMVSGVGGQFNFVSMAYEIPEARSILMMRACRHKAGKPVSNIVFNYGHVTVPRHMRDIVITEFGIADLRGKTDEEVIIELLKVADSRFQDDLIAIAQKAGKLHEGFELPVEFRNNTSESLKTALGENLATDFSPFPFGKELTDQEVVIGASLKKLLVLLGKPWKLIPPILLPPSKAKAAVNQENLKRMRLDSPASLKERIMRRLLLSVLPDAKS